MQNIDDAPARATNLNSRVQVYAKTSLANVSEHDVDNMAKTTFAAAFASPSGGFFTWAVNLKAQCINDIQ